MNGVNLFFSALLLSAYSAAADNLSTASYAPEYTKCAATDLVRPATGLGTGEAQYRTERKKIADVALKKWLSKTHSGFDPNVSDLPTIGLTTSGGGYRSFLVGAGVIQGFDERESELSTAGIFQALTYQSGLSGGGWLLSSFAGNNYPTITELKRDLWEKSFLYGLLTPEGAEDAYGAIHKDLEAKNATGFSPTLTDPYGRLLSHQFFKPPQYGVDLTLSSIAGFSNLTQYAVPYPIIVSLGVKTFNGECLPGPNATIYEFSPYEFGSWDSDVSAFVSTKYLGTNFTNGKPVNGNKCVVNYDNIGYILGTSSSLFNEVCLPVPHSQIFTSDEVKSLEENLDKIHEISTRDQYAIYPNPFYKYQPSNLVKNPANPIYDQDLLHLVDGGEALQNNPIWPMLQPVRGVDVLIVNDNSADTKSNWPNGSEVLTTFQQSVSHNLTRMPYIPPVSEFVNRGLNKLATFFGCDDDDTMTIVYLPNNAFIYPSNVPTAKLEYAPFETDGMINNGMAVASQGLDPAWGTCLGCAIMKKTGTTLPPMCSACFLKHCYKEIV